MNFILAAGSGGLTGCDSAGHGILSLLSDALHHSKRAAAGANEPVLDGQLAEIKKALWGGRSLRARERTTASALHNFLPTLSLGNHSGN